MARPARFTWVRTLAFAIVTTAVGTARAELAPPRIAPMTLASDEVCELLKSDRHDTCKPAAQLDRAKVYQAGASHGIRRYVLAIDRGDDTLISPSIDLPAEDGTLDRATPTITAVEIDGHPGFVLDVVSSFHRGTKRARTSWQTEAIVGCTEVDAVWKCVTVEPGACAATIDPDGSITTSCGDRVKLSTRR